MGAKFKDKRRVEIQRSRTFVFEIFVRQQVNPWKHPIFSWRSVSMKTYGKIIKRAQS